MFFFLSRLINHQSTNAAISTEMMTVGAMTFAADQDECLSVGKVSERDAADPVLVLAMADDALATNTLLMVVLNVGKDREVSTGVAGNVGTPSSSPIDVNGTITSMQPSLVPSSGLSECMQRLNVKEEECVNEGGLCVVGIKVLGFVDVATVVVVVVEVKGALRVDKVVLSKDCPSGGTSPFAEVVLVLDEFDSMTSSFCVDEGREGPSNRKKGFTVVDSTVLDGNSEDARTETTNVVSTVNVTGTVNVPVFQQTADVANVRLPIVGSEASAA